MGSRREDDKNEATIRRLLKLPENKRCINCNSLGPQYVCTNFSTFVCTPCSGIHREFSHRIKSISMAKFTAAEVAALQAGGNERARQVYFKSLDLARVSLPDSGSPEKLRDFMRRVYEKKHFTGDSPPTAQQEEPVVESPRSEPKVGRSSDLRSLSFDDHVGAAGKGSPFNRRKSDFERTGSRGSPKATTGGSPQAPPPRPTRPLSYDDRDERLEQPQQQRQSPNTNGRERRAMSRPFSFKDFGVTPPPVQSITDILGDIPGLRVEVFKHPNGEYSPDSSARSSVDSARRTRSFGSAGDDRPTAVEYKRANSSSLIDLNGESPRPSQDPFAEASLVSPATSDSWATFNASPTPPAPPAGYPAPKTETSNQWAEPKTETSNQWAEAGWGQQQQQTTTATTTTGNLDTWSSFGTPSPPKAVPNQELYNAIPSSGSQGTSSPGQHPRVRRQLPQNFYAPSLEDHLPHLNVHQHQHQQPAFRPPLLGNPMEAYYNMGFPPNLQNSQTQLFQAQGPNQYPPQGQPQGPFQPPAQQRLPSELSHQMPVQSQMPVQRSRNPFDDDFEDESPASRSSSTPGVNMQFPSLEALQAALPSVSSGVPSMEAVATTAAQSLPTSAASSDWAYSFTQYNDSTSSSGSFNFSSDQTATPFQMSSTPAPPNVSRGYNMSSPPFGLEAPFPGHHQVHPPNMVRPAGGNPFG